MADTGVIRYLPWRIVDVNSDPVLGRQLSALQVTFLRDTVVCTDILVLHEQGNGLYFLEYTPSAAGEDYLDIYDPVNDLRLTDNEVIVPGATGAGSNIVSLTQDYGGIGALKPQVANPNQFTLYVFNSQVWQAGNTNALKAAAYTSLDSSGNWLITPLSVPPNTYHLVLISNNGTVIVFRAFLSLSVSQTQ